MAKAFGGYFFRKLSMERKDVMRYVLFINRFVGYSLVEKHSGRALLKTHDRYRVKIVLGMMGLKFRSYETTVKRLLDDTVFVGCRILLGEDTK